MLTRKHRLQYWKCVNGLARAVSIGFLCLGMVASLLEVCGLLSDLLSESSELSRCILIERVGGLAVLLSLTLVGWLGMKARPYYPSDLRDSVEE